MNSRARAGAVSLLVAWGVLASASASAEGMEERLRTQLRSTTQQLQALQSEQAQAAAARIAAEKGEVTAEVTSAAALSADQTKKLAATLKARVGKDVKLKVAVDESLIGGLVVKLGSTMIDTSVKAKLAALQNAMKEVG